LENVEILSHSLKSIHLGHNLIENWPLQAGTDAIPYIRLESLHLASNQIERLPERALHVLPQLETLDLSDNRLTSLSHGSVPTLELHLKHLNLSGNYMTTFRPPILPSLAVLDLSANNLVELSDDFWIATPSLQRLRLGHNPQTLKINWSTIMDGKSNQLIELDLSHNLLHSIPELQSFRHLRSLDLSGNQLVYGKTFYHNFNKLHF
jgi:Leucine-rich repeat (LRR) protein